MANKIVKLQNYQLSSTDYEETFLDISMVSEKSSLNAALSCPSIYDYLQYLKADPAYQSEISAIAIDPSNSLEENIRQLAMLLNTDYYEEYEKYQQYLNRSRYKIANLNDVNATKNSIHNIFTWIPGQRILNPTFGSRLQKLIYEGISDQTNEKIVAEIRNAVMTQEPRVQIVDIINMTNTYEIENNTVHFEIVFTIPALTQDKQYSETLIYNTTQI